MARKRMIDPDIWESESFLSFPTDRMRLSFICLFSNADDEGKGRSSVLSAKAKLTLLEIKDTIKLFEDKKSIFFYYVQEGLDEILYYQLPKWFKFQRIDHPQKSKIPNHPDFDKIIPKEFQEKYLRMDSNNEFVERNITQYNIRKVKLKEEKDIMSETNPISDVASPSSQEKENPPPKFSKDSRSYKMATWFYEQVEPNLTRKKPPNFQAWAKDCDGLLRIDAVTSELIDEVVTWVVQDNFESTNILCPAKLRKRFDSLVLKMRWDKKKAEQGQEEEWWPLNSPERIEQDRRRGIQ